MPNHDLAAWQEEREDAAVITDRTGMAIKAGVYWWVRDLDETGMSGAGRVGQVAVFEDGSAVLRWIKSRNSAGVQSSVFYETIADLLWVHGHGEKKTGHLEPVFHVGDHVFIHCIEGFGGPARILADRDSASSHYQVEMLDGSQPKPFWAHDFEVHRSIAGDNLR